MDAQDIIGRIGRLLRNCDPIRIMEVCGTHTVALFRSGIKSMLPERVRLISGPGCPVCVTSSAYIDAACELTARPELTICTYGDMVRVPGRLDSLEACRGRGARVRVVYSARDSVQYATRHPSEQVVFLAVGFETTAPATAAAVLEAEAAQLTNFTILSAHKLVIPAMTALLAAGDVPIDGFMCPGHVSVVIGSDAYQPIATQFHKPCVVVGFEPAQMLTGILRLVEQAVAGNASVENVYGVAVNHDGNSAGRACIDRVFAVQDAVWRAMGTIPRSGLELREEYRRFDARHALGVTYGADHEPPGCLCGEVIQGKVDPVACSLFGTTCSPTRPIGPCMVSSEGTCAAWHKYGRPGRYAEAGARN